MSNFAHQDSFFVQRNTDVIHAIRVGLSPGYLTIILNTYTTNDENFQEFSSINEAERHLLNNLESYKVPRFDIIVPESLYKITAKIHAMSNSIAMCTRRGRGDTLICHPVWEFFLSSLKRNYKLYSTEHCPPDKIVCLYNGNGREDYNEEFDNFTVDTGFVYLTKSDGKSGLWKLPGHINAMNDHHDYIRYIDMMI